jgi:general secretion pathway protein D
MVRAIFAGIVVFLVSFLAKAADVDFSCKNCEIVDVVAKYSKLSGKSVVIDPEVRGKINILAPSKISLDEAFALLSESLSSQGYAFVGEGELHLMQSRNASRNLLPVYSELPPLKPQRLVVWVRTMKKMKAEEAGKQLRNLSSRDGEAVFLASPDRLVLTDYTGNIHRVSKLLDQIDP